MSLVDLIKRYLCNAASSVSLRMSSLKMDGIFSQSIANLPVTGTTQVNANLLPASFTRITTGATGGTVYLPATVIKGSQLTGTTYTVRNDSSTQGAVISVYPTNTLNNGSINGGGINNPYLLGWGTVQTFTTIDGNNWFTTGPIQSTGGVSTLSALADTTLTTGQAGMTFLVPATAATRVVNLPSATTLPQGARYRFVASGNGAGGSNTFAITPNTGTSDTAIGAASMPNASAASINKQYTAALNVTFSTAYKIGDWIEFSLITSLGGANCWFVSGIGTNSASFA